jgi:hypothetical protein
VFYIPAPAPLGPGGPGVRKRGRRGGVEHMNRVIRGDKVYVYRSVRRGRRVGREYVGAGPDFDLVARLDAHRRDIIRENRAELRRIERAELARLDEINREQAERSGLMDVLGRLALEAAGFHRHKRSEWRRRRRMGEASGATKIPLAFHREPPAPREEILALAQRASKGDESAMPRLLEIFNADPERMTVAMGGDIAWIAENAAIQRMAGSNLIMAHALGAKLEALRVELAGPDASPVERLLAERVALCWLDVHDWDARHNQATTEGFKAGHPLSPVAHEHYQAMRDRANRRYLLALKALAQVQRMAPTIKLSLMAAGPRGSAGGDGGMAQLLHERNGHAGGGSNGDGHG